MPTTVERSVVMGHLFEEACRRPDHEAIARKETVPSILPREENVGRIALPQTHTKSLQRKHLL